MYTIKTDELDFVSEYSLKFSRQDVSDGLIAYFKVIFSEINSKYTIFQGNFFKKILIMDNYIISQLYFILKKKFKGKRMI